MDVEKHKKVKAALVSRRQEKVAKRVQQSIDDALVTNKQLELKIAKFKEEIEELIKTTIKR